jgi:integrase
MAGHEKPGAGFPGCFPSCYKGLDFCFPGWQMKLTKQSVTDLVLPEGKTDVIFFDDALPGFGVRLRAGGRAVWIVQYRTPRGQRRETLGDIRKLELDAVRAAAKKIFARVLLGADPQGEKAEARQRDKQTLGAVVTRYLEFKQSKLRPSSYGADKRYLTKHWKPLHGLPIHAIKRRDVAVRLSEITAENGTIAAARARGTLSAFFVWAIKDGIADENPVTGTNNPAAGAVSRERVLKEHELRSIWNACRNDDFGRIIKLLMMTGARRDEIGGLRWDEINPDSETLSIPGTRTKNHHPLVLPLPSAAIDILKSAPRREGRELVFGGRGAGFSAWSYSTLAMAARIMEAEGKSLAPWRIHDIRRTAATGMAELGVEPHIVETILNHRSGHKSGDAGTYNRAVYERQVRAALLMWADHLQAIIDGSDPKVLPMRREVPA